MCAGCLNAEIHRFHFRGAGGPERFLDTQTGRRETSPPSRMKRVPDSKWQPFWVSHGEFLFPGEGKRGLRPTIVKSSGSSLALPLVVGKLKRRLEGPACCSVRCRSFRGAPVGTSNLGAGRLPQACAPALSKSTHSGQLSLPSSFTNPKFQAEVTLSQDNQRKILPFLIRHRTILDSRQSPSEIRCCRRQLSATPHPTRILRARQGPEKWKAAARQGAGWLILIDTLIKDG